MAGYMTYCPFEGEVIHRMYQYPWVVRGKNALPLRVEEDAWTTLAAFGTQDEAEKFLKRTEADYRAGSRGHTEFAIENWNE